MLELRNIKKDYFVADEAVHALKGISVKFRKSEFVSILGPSGCGKTTLLNIIGGLDQYTSGDLLIQGVSTEKFGDRDWDTYRNHSIGFIFQSYHLIPHQTILQNVELALMISGVSKKERRRRAIEALDRVGLKDKIHNRPNQLSGGQAQRVAIARALINDPEIVLADEPTGALDSKTSVQIMELLKEISRERLVIMVTHNPELAERYSTRIVRLLDGQMIDDTMPYDGKDEPPVLQKNLTRAEKKELRKKKGSKKKTAMSPLMAMGLSLKNLLSKGKRTAMVSVAGSIGIIGVSMVLAISSGVQAYITDMENDMLSGYPVSITQSAYDFTSLMELNGGSQEVDLKELASGNKVYVNSLLDTLGTFSTGFQKTNTLTDDYLKYVEDIPEKNINLIQYGYSFKIANNIYTDFTVSDDLASHLKEGDTSEYNGGTMSVSAIRAMYSAVLTHVEEYKQWGSMISTVSTFAEIPNNYDYIMSQYDVVAIDRDGQVVTENFSQEELKQTFEAKDSMIMVLNNYKMDDLTLAQYGYFTEDEFLDYAYKGVDSEGHEDTQLVGADGLPYSVFVGADSKKFTYYPNDCVYTQTNYIPAPTVSDENIIRYFGSVPDGDMTLAQKIIAARTAYGDEGLRTMYRNDAVLRAALESFAQQMGTTMTEDDFVGAFHLPTEQDGVKGFVANAYTTPYVYNNKTPFDDSDDVSLPAFSDKTDAYAKRVEMGVKMILQKKESVSYGCLDSGFYYTNALTNYILQTEAESQIVKFIKENGSLENVPMYVDYYYVKDEVKEPAEEGGEQQKVSYYVLSTVEGTIESGGSMMSEIVGSITGTTSAGLEAGLFGGSDTPIGIYIYPVDFNAKNEITNYLDAWNSACENGTTITLSDGTQISGLEEGNKITYTDTVGIIINMVNTMIQMVTIALIAFTALSLVVSTVMIGIITYVSVVERVKEIGILRAVGARKKDIKRLFNAETFIIGLVAGLFGILITYLLSFIINIIVLCVAGIWGIAALPWWQALIMIALSILLTLISGLIPASAAAKKDPVVALRTE